MKSKKIIAIVLSVLFVLPAAVYAGTTAYTKNINVTYGITITRNGEPIEWIDSNGKQVDAFVYENTAYVPLKTLAPILGASTQYSYENNTVNITDHEQLYAFLWGFEAAHGYMKIPEEYKKVLEGMGYSFDSAQANSRSDWLSEAQTDYYNIGKNRLDEINNGTATNQSQWQDIYNAMGQALENAGNAGVPNGNSGRAEGNSSLNSATCSFPLHIYSNDGKVYLGKCVTDKFDDKSIWYPLIGDYSSEYSSTSIWNEYSDYGGTLLSYDKSAFNDHATHPPIIVDNNGIFVAYLTTNSKIENGWTITELRQFVENNGQ